MRPARELRVGVRGLLKSLPLIVFAYCLVGTIGALAMVPGEALGSHSFWGAAELLSAVLGVFVVFTYILLPLGLLCLDEFGLAFGHVLEGRGVVSMWLRTSPGVLMVAMIGTALVLQEYLRTGEVAAAPLALVATVIPYAIVIMLLNMRYTTHSLNSIGAFLGAAAAGRKQEAAELRVESLDQIGVMVMQVRELVRQLEASEARVRGFADAASDLYFETDEAVRITWVSERVEAITGFPPHMIVGRSFREVVEDLGVEFPREQAEQIWSCQPFRDLVITLPRPDGAERRLRVSGVPMFDAQGLFTGYRGVATDVTDMVLAEERLREREVQLAQAQKMEAVGQLTGGVAHDFNNLLLVVAGNLELARDEGDAEERRQLLDAALEASQRGAGLVQHLLAFSRRQVLRPEAVDLRARLESLITLLHTTLGERVDLRVELGNELHHPLVDVAQLESALLNLAINARDAMPKGGRLTVRAGNRRLVGGEHDLPPGDYVEIRMEDSGVGMSPAVLERVFEPFFSTKPVGAGTGLGLSMVYGFVTQSRGAVDVRSTEGVGTTVTLLLPVADGVADGIAEVRAEVRAEEPEQVERERRGERILMVEDEPAVRRAVMGGLEAAGYEVVPAEDGDAARALVDAGLVVDLVLSDVVLPGSRSGVDLIAELRRELPSLPCLLMSGYTDDHLSEAPPELEGVTLLQKPFRIRQLVAHVDALLEAQPGGASRRPRLVAVGPGPDDGRR
ncbi:MAG: ATP-binding protein [Pseudomonadales bacterium]|jgi:PAS domain S-box-containing protein|nr:ATP-binding protein [Pseudomonadales bacterium]